MPPVQWCRIYLLSKYFFGIIILKKNRNVYAKIYYKLPSQILIFWYLWQIGLTNIYLIETLDKYFILRYDENCGSCFAAEQFVDIKCFYNIWKRIFSCHIMFFSFFTDNSIADYEKKRQNKQREQGVKCWHFERKNIYYTYKRQTCWKAGTQSQGSKVTIERLWQPVAALNSDLVT